jgi:uridine kinase
VSSSRAGAPAPTRSVIAVDGIDGSGKSILARQLTAAADRAGLATVVLGVDDFRRPVDWSQGGRAEADIYYDDYYDLAHLDRCLRAFLDGASSVEIPVFDSRTERLEGTRTVPFAGAAVAVVEGVFALRVGAVAAGAALLYLRTSFSEARRRILARDTARGRTPENVSHRIDARYFPSQERYLREHDPVGRADVIIENEDFAAPHLARFEAARLHPALAEALPAVCGAFATPRGVE